MGKWAQYSKRGTARQHGTTAAPVAADWSVGTITSTSVQTNRLVPLPPAADGWRAQVQLQAGGSIVSESITSGSTPLTVSGLTAVTPYRVRVSWWKSTWRVSDWSAWTNFTTV